MASPLFDEAFSRSRLIGGGGGRSAPSAVDVLTARQGLALQDGRVARPWAISEREAGDFATQTLHDAYLAVLAGASPPAGFNNGILVFIPKAALQLGQDEHRAPPRDLRPLTLGNTPHKAIMLLINEMRERFASSMVHQSHCGFVRGRDLLTNVAELEGAITGYLHDDEAEPAAVLLDVAAALPSAEWGYIHWALTRPGIPAAVIEALFAMYTPTSVDFVVDGRATGTRLRDSGDSVGMSCQRDGVGPLTRFGREKPLGSAAARRLVENCLC